MSQNYSLPMATGSQGPDAESPQVRSRRMLLMATLVTVGLMFVPYSNYLLYPLRLFVTFVHESGHALASVFAGGTVDYIRLSPDTSGVTWSATPPWATWLVDSGGYLGSALFGALLLQVARFNRWREMGRAALYVMSAALLTITLLWAHNPLKSGLFTPVVGLLLAATLWALGRYSRPRVAEFAAAFLAVQCSLNALVDLRILFTITSGNLGDNDAKFMSQAYGLPPVFWAVLWAALALGILGVSLMHYWRGTQRQRPVVFH